MADVCVDDVDFQVELGQLRLLPHFVQTGNRTFVYELDGADGVFEQVTDIPPVIVPLDGIWVVTVDVRGTAVITPTASGVDAVAAVLAELRLNGALVPASQTTVSRIARDLTTTVQPQFEVSTTGSVTRVMTLAAGDLITVWGARMGTPVGVTTQIVSNGNGQTRLTMWRIGGL